MLVEDVLEEENIVRIAEWFHGHLGPCLVLGLKMTLQAFNILGVKRGEKVYIYIETPGKPPYTCVIDGIQVASGCTVGNGRLKHGIADKIRATFRKDNKKVDISIKFEVIEWINNNLYNIPTNHPKLRDIAESILKSDPYELFLVKIQNSSEHH